MINASEGGIDYLWSSIAQSENFQNGSIPMPLVVSDGRNPGEKQVGLNSTNFEFNPFEFGSFDPTVYGFAPLQYLGSKFSSGQLPNNESCILGYDNAGYIYGTSSTLFNQILLQVNSTDVPEIVKEAITEVLQTLDNDEFDVAKYINPFYGYRQNSGVFADLETLILVDGGEDNQNIPLHPVIQPQRQVDVVFAVDSTADIHNWPNGSSLVNTYRRSLNSTGIANGTVFPPVPDENTFINLGLNTRPTFFGCDSSNMTGPTPLIVYLPNYPYIAYSNVSTFQLTWDNSQRDAVIANGAAVVTQANSTRDSNWPACVGCAILSRSLHRTNTPVPSICSQCFQTYCWNGTIDSTPPPPYYPVAYSPAANVTNSESAAPSLDKSITMYWIGLCMILTTMVAL
jgi:lysophospholipase